MKDNAMKEFLEKIARRNIPDDTNLMPGIAAELERKSLMVILRARPLTAILLALLLLTILSGVAYAIGRSFGFSPSVGIVETSSLRTLAEPVILERDGFRVTVTEAAVDSAHTVIRYQVEWPTPPPTEGEFDTTCQGSPTLTLPDGTLVGQGVTASDGKGVLENGYWYRLEFSTVAAGQNDVNLVIPCLVSLVPGPLPRDWQFSLHFVPWDGTPLAPVYLAPTQTLVPSPIVEQSTPAAPDYGITFALEHVTELESGYVFEGSATWTDASIEPYSVSPYAAHLTDATGQVIPLEETAPQTRPSGNLQNRWAFESAEKPTAFPVTLTIDGYTFRLAAQASFPFDFGAAPQPDQVWNLDLDLPIAGHTLHIDSATLIDNPGMRYLEFNLSSDESVIGATLFDLQNTSGQGGGGGGGEPQPGPFTATVYYDSSFPSGVTQITVARLEIVVKTPWQTTWQP
ncbi:MAG: hypothetical protein EHM40_07285 [Chloroflexi bacterium]|nr:MAG: hypothetical protein EHM40_07285 [Chloroflexota bacterium]